MPTSSLGLLSCGRYSAAVLRRTRIDDPQRLGQRVVDPLICRHGLASTVARNSCVSTVRFAGRKDQSGFIKPLTAPVCGDTIHRDMR